MLTREELAKEIFIADNSRLTRDQAEREWAEFQGPDITEYAHNIAAGLMPLIKDAQAAAWDACDDAWTAAHKMSHHEPWEYMDDSNPYRKDTP